MNTPAETEALLGAVQRGDLAEVQRMIAAGINVNCADNQKRTPLLYAVNFKHNTIVEVLLAAGADVSARDSLNQTALHYAATVNNAGAVPLLTRAGLNVDVRGFDSPADGPSESTPLHLSAQAGGLEVTAALITAGADVNALTNVKNGLYRRSPLFWAEKSGHTAVAELLKAKGAVKYPPGATMN